ncbi:MAG: BREX-1 system adenine-specific DNA-methyltransferase PglX [Burkholderiales bacterium]|nr:BREX-1 system adenine-specific DNA-methyltransferase PglX [Burkholderiales bacterium]
MDRETRNAIERATQRARKLLEEDFAAQLDGDFDVHRDGTVAAKAGGHLSAKQAFQRERIVAAIEHKRAAGMSAAVAARDYLRDAAFTTLNRFVALKMLEARELVQECITKGEQSAGYREFCGMAPGLPLLPDSAGYRFYIESLFDELSTEVKVLFDRRDPSTVLWPKRATFEQLIEILNANELALVWGEDETIGWVYQFFNGQDERKKMREESQGPRNSRELAVRNQFFTPRYVVQFLTDNTLGRIWYEMRGIKTVLAERCEYMVRKPGEEFAPRAKKDPRDLRVLDPACGSGHFLLYAFDLLLAIYEEAHADPKSPRSEATGKTLAEDYPTPDALRKAVPGLVLAHNLHGVEIDPRCAQIAQLALWMRAQKAYRDFGIVRDERGQIRRSNIVLAEPLVADEQIAKEFVAKLGDVELGRVFTSLVEALNLAGELGLLLRVEQVVKPPAKKQGDLFAPPEERIRAALELFVRVEAAGANARRRLFFDDATHGIDLLELAETKFDVVLMNPPFGESSKIAEQALSGLYPAWNRNLLCSFIARSSELCCVGGLVGTVIDRTIANKTTYEAFRRAHLLSQPELVGMADLGWDVLDANVEVAALVLAATTSGHESAWFVDVRELGDNRGTALRESLGSNASPIFWRHARQSFGQFPSHAIVYDLPEALLSSFSRVPSLESRGLRAFTGHQLQSSRHFFCSWEMVQQAGGDTDVGKKVWSRLYNGGDYSRFLLPHCEAVRFGFYRDLEPRDVTDYTFVLRNRQVHLRSGVAFGVRGEVLDAHVVSAGFVFTVEGQIVPIDDDNCRYYLAGFLNSSVASRLLNSFCGQHKYSGYVNCLPCPEPGSAVAGKIAILSRQACEIKARWFAHRESCDWFSASVVAGTGVRDATELAAFVVARARADEARLEEILAQIDALVLEGIDSDDDESRRDIEGYRRGKMPKEDLLGVLFGADDPALGLAKSIFSIAVGCCFGLHDSSAIDPSSSEKDPGKEKPAGQSPLFSRARSEHRSQPVLVDDPGHAADLATRLEALLDKLFGTQFRTDLARSLGFFDLRQYLRASKGAFSDHLRTYSDGGRTAPIYWQLATPSASYSVWLYIHAFSKDTLFRVQNDYAAPKLAHEERRLELLTSELRDGATAAQRKQLAAQQVLVEELRAFLDEVKRVAPLWWPNLDDGVIINFAPLWRLVPQNKSWQKELKSTWDTLCEGKYDWAHLAMHLWPERVVPKCAKDRSLAIAHGLEDVFWVEGTDGKWTARKTPTRSVDELVRERTSPAVKSALKSLLEAPAAAGNSGGRRGGGRRTSATAAEGGDA